MLTSNWFLTRNASKNQQIRIICFPYAGGNASTYIPWHKCIPSNVELVAIQLPGRASRLNDAPLTSMEQIIEELMGHITQLTDIPYVLFGHSLGCRIAFALAEEIRTTPHRQPKHLFASGSLAPHHKRKGNSLHKLPDSEFIRAVSQLNGTPREVYENEELLGLMLPALRADFGIAETYKATGNPIDCPISVLYGNEDPETPLFNLQSWKELSSSKVKFFEVPGDHFFIQKETKVVTKVVTAILGMEMKKWSILTSSRS